MKSIKKMFLMLLAIVVPWVILLMNDNPGGAFVALIMQASVVGWPFAAAWAWKLLKEPAAPAAKKQKK